MGHTIPCTGYSMFVCLAMANGPYSRNKWRGTDEKSPLLLQVGALNNYALGLHLSGFRLIHQHLASIIEFALMPMRPVVQMHLTGSGIRCQCRGHGLVMCSSLVSPGFGDFSFRMCHFNLYLSVNSFFNSSHLGSFPCFSFLSSLGSNAFRRSNAADFKLPSSTPGCTLFWGTAKTSIS